jgi:hypothetical protein
MSVHPVPTVLHQHLANNPVFLEIWNTIPANIRLEDRPDTLMSPRVLAARLDEAGIPIAVATLERLRSAGGGPVFAKFGKSIIYPWGSSLCWALDKLGRWRANTSAAEGEGAVSNLSKPTPWSMPAKPRPSTAAGSPRNPSKGRSRSGRPLAPRTSTPECVR